MYGVTPSYPLSTSSFSLLTFCCSFGHSSDNKRKGEDNQEKTNSAKTRRVDQLQGITHNKTIDLIVLGLAWKTTQAGMREYFEQFGELLICEVSPGPMWAVTLVSDYTILEQN